MEYKEIKYNDILISTFRELVDFLEKHELRWFVGFGTLIGTIRHHGLIPWDDDIDILMPRQDFDKLLELYKKEKSNYYIKSLIDINYPFAFGKFCHKDSTIVETKLIPCTFGVYVDIFPFDDAGNDLQRAIKYKLKYELLHRNYEHSCNKYSLEYILSMIKGGRILNLWSCIKDNFLHLYSKNLIKKMMMIENYFKEDSEGNYYVVLCGLYGKRDLYKKEWFSNYVLMKFENIEVRVPIGYDECLKMIYGDYMQLPPIEHRVSKHLHVYENLDRGMTINEARNYFRQKIE